MSFTRPQVRIANLFFQLASFPAVFASQTESSARAQSTTKPPIDYFTKGLCIRRDQPVALLKAFPGCTSNSS